RVAATASCTCCGICARTGRSPAPCPGLLIRAVCSVISSLLLGSLGSNPLCAFEAADYRIRTDKVDSNGLTRSRQFLRSFQGRGGAVLAGTGQGLAANRLQTAHHIVAATAEVVVQHLVFGVELVVGGLGLRVRLIGTHHTGPH